MFCIIGYFSNYTNCEIIMISHIGKQYLILQIQIKAPPSINHVMLGDLDFLLLNI